MRYCIFIFLIFYPLSSYSKNPHAVVFMYHRFDQNKYPETSISSETFEKHILFLRDNKVDILPLTDLVLFLKNKKQLTKKSAFITIDDAYKSFYKKGYPILKKYNLPFSIFVSTDFVSNKKTSDYMSWDMLREVSKNNGLVLNHTSSHKSLINLSFNSLKREVQEAQQIIEKEIGLQPMILSFPYGESDVESEKMIKKLGYNIAFSQHSSLVHRGELKFRLPRFSLNDEYGGMKRFKTIIKAKPLVIFNESFKDTLVNSDNLIFDFDTNVNSELINCFVNNEAFIKEISDKKKNLMLHINNLKEGQRYRINCTYVDQEEEIFWYGKMIKRIN